MRENFERIIAWAKAHPWQAALILGVTILLGYLAYKKFSDGGGGGSGELFEPAEPAPSSDVSFPDVGGGGGISGGGGIGEGSDDEVAPISQQPAPDSEYTTPSPSYDFPVPDYTPAYNSIGVSSSEDVASYAIPSAPSPISRTVGGVKPQAVVEKSAPKAVARKGIFDVTRAPVAAAKVAMRTTPPLAVTSLTGGGLGIIANIVKKIIKPKKKDSLGVQVGDNSLLGGAVASTDIKKPPVVKKQLRRTASTSTAPRTPAQLVGMPYNYTGWRYGIYYLNGYPSSPLASVGTVNRGR